MTEPAVKPRTPSWPEKIVVLLIFFALCDFLTYIFAPAQAWNPFHPQAPHYQSPVKPYTYTGPR